METNENTQSALSELIESYKNNKEIYGTKRDDEVGELARIMTSIRDEINSSEINLHTLMIERERQEYLMSTIDHAAFALLAIAAEDEKEFNQALREGLTVVAQCVDVDGIYIWRNDTRDNDKVFELQAQWTNHEDKSGKRHKQYYFYKNTPDWEERFSTGMPLNGPKDSFTEEDQKFLGANTRSILVLPVYLHEHFWGLVYFEDHKRERTFTADEIALLQSASLMVVSAVRRKMQTARINEANARVKLMMDSTPIGCLLWNSNFEVYDCNPATLSLFNVSSKEEMIKQIRAFTPVYQPNGKTSEELRNIYLKKAFEDGSCDFDWICSTSDGTLLPVEVTLRRVMHEGKYTVAEYIRDVREQKRLMHELENRGKELEAALKETQAASKAKTDFLSNMSHEIRTPMNAITGMTSIGKTADGLQAKDDAFEKIESASNHLLGVINDILDMSKIEAGKLDIYEEPFNLEKTLNTALDIVMFRIEEKNQIFHIEISEDMPPVIIGDSQRLSQILTNLLGNAVKFTPEGKEIRLVAKLMERVGDRCSIQFSIIDQGIGISKKQQDRIFSSFEQAEKSTTRNFGGTGLGLAISKHIVQLMGGHIWVESEIGEGSNFSFVINVEVRDKELKAEHQALALEDMTYPGKVMLLAEDVEINQEIVMAILESTEIEIDCAENGEEAVKMFEENPGRYHLIFMDVQMPVMDGFEATERIRNMDAKEAKTVPIVAMTANVFREDVERCLAAGMNAHLGKPLDIDAVMTTLWDYLR